jgi:diadenosine tetraphosphatase ApaH/serine/threonine PP2A family protein phosphatase
MRYAVLSDIHSNLEAFSSVLSRISELDIDRIICLGDIVGYNANPNECVELIKERAIIAINGNHDEEAVSTKPPLGLNPIAEESILWTRQALNSAHKDFLKALPITTLVDGLFTAFHAPRNSKNKYIHSSRAAETIFKTMRQSKSVIKAKTIRLAFVGHTHVRCVFTEIDEMIFEKTPTEPLVLEKNNLYLINPGSVGQPRGGDPRASFLTFDSTLNKIEFHHVEYDIETTIQKIKAAGLPNLNAKRLTLGQ